jgi:8-oxo-dGTP diphosphatase
VTAAAASSVRREYPAAPIVGVAGVVVRGNEVLLIRRGREPLLGSWSLPGGALEVGETMAEGVAREVFEETGLRVRPVEIVATLDRIVRDEDGRVRFHYLLIDWMCEVVKGRAGDPLPGDDALAAVWVRGEEPQLEAYGLEAIARRVIGDALGRARVLGL